MTLAYYCDWNGVEGADADVEAEPSRAAAAAALGWYFRFSWQRGSRTKDKDWHLPGLANEQGQFIQRWETIVPGIRIPIEEWFLLLKGVNLVFISMYKVMGQRMILTLLNEQHWAGVARHSTARHGLHLPICLSVVISRKSFSRTHTLK